MTDIYAMAYTTVKEIGGVLSILATFYGTGTQGTYTKVLCGSKFIGA